MRSNSTPKWRGNRKIIQSKFLVKILQNLVDKGLGIGYNKKALDGKGFTKSGLPKVLVDKNGEV